MTSPTDKTSMKGVASALTLASGIVIGFYLRKIASWLKPPQAANDVPESAPCNQNLTRPPPGFDELKMILVVNHSLGMGKGKLAAQCAHAAAGLYQHYHSKLPVLFQQWDMTGGAKIAVKCNNAEELDELAVAAQEAGIPSYMVRDQGRTQIAAGSQTVLAIGPAPKSMLSPITDHLKLL